MRGGHKVMLEPAIFEPCEAHRMQVVHILACGIGCHVGLFWGSWYGRFIPAFWGYVFEIPLALECLVKTRSWRCESSKKKASKLLERSSGGQITWLYSARVLENLGDTILNISRLNSCTAHFYFDFYCAAVPRVRETNFKMSRGENFRLIKEYKKFGFLNSYSRKTRNPATFFDPMTSEMLKR